METVQLIILVLGVGLGFFVQTVAGLAGGLFALPIILQAFPMQDAVAYLSIFLCIFSILMVFKTWTQIDKTIVKELAAGIIAGLGMGVLLLKTGNPMVLKKILGVFILLFIGYHLISNKKIRLPGKLGILFGLAGGFFSGVFSAGGPTYVIYVYNKIHSASVFRATIIGILSITNILRIPMLIASEILTTDILIHSLYILPIFTIALFFGNRIYGKINEVLFKNILFILLAASGISLIVR
ncbi:MAG: sulfite exporter TauE/SafE family protein, partial [Bacteroidales bacterium]|nr:sulfite exporter TauE/SafE family protein [Bacteroidales bacterium]MBS3775829.1 sulfite exporter TauE/SafE family protein [Bacteroidales bacterium]